METESLDHDAILPTEKIWIVLYDGIANFTIGNDHYELFVKDRVRGNINVSFRYNFGSGYFELYRLSATGKDLFTISKISKVVHEVIYET